MSCVLVALAGVVLCCLVDSGAAWADWTVVVPESYAGDEAIRVAIEDLKEAGDSHGTTIRVVSESEPVVGNAILIGNSERNRVARQMRDAGALNLTGVANAEGYEIVTVAAQGRKTIVVAGGSALGDAYGLYWIWDRLRVYGEIPDIHVKHVPALGTRFTRIVVQSEADIRRALRLRLNMVFGENPLSLIPWNAEPERSENEIHRAHTRKLANYAHAVHLKFVAFGTDFTYHPSLLKDFNATLNPSDPHFWEAVQAKYRLLLLAMPELDGVCTFTADEQAYWGNYKTFDVIHGGEGCDWGLDKRCRTYIAKVWEVVAGEFDKLLLYHTWSTSVFEQQSQAGVFRAIFTDAVPTRNLYLFPSFTQCDRWWFQAYNPTINQTPHNTMVICETMDYHAGGRLFPTFPGLYFQSGLKSMLDVKSSNLKGLSLDMPSEDDWQTRNLTAYTVSRLAWNHHEKVESIAEDFAAIHFGRPAAKNIAQLLLMSPIAYAYGLYIEPASYGEFNSLPHIRVGQFVADGYTCIDGGKEHMEFLYKIYLRCRPWLPETLMYLDHGLDTADKMVEEYDACSDLVADKSLREDLGQAVQLTQLLVRANNRYVKTFFAYFDYRENLTEENRRRLDAAYAGLLETRNRFASAPGFGYQLFGIDQLLLNVTHMLQNPSRAARILAETPTRQEIEKTIAEEQERGRAALEKYGAEAVKVLHWRGKVDGEDILRMRGSEVSGEHLRWDPVNVEICEAAAALPQIPCTVIPKNLQSRALHPFVLEQPSRENGYTVEVYLNDLPGGADWWELELYYIPRPPAELGLRPSMKARF